MYVVFRTTPQGEVEYYTTSRRFTSLVTQNGPNALKLFRTKRMAQGVATLKNAEYDALH